MLTSLHRSAGDAWSTDAPPSGAVVVVLRGLLGGGHRGPRGEPRFHLQMS